MDPDRQTLAAFVDGELPPKDMERIALLLAARPDLDAYVRQQERLRSTLRTHFNQELAQVPERLANAIHDTPISWRWRMRFQLGNGFLTRTLAPACATLALGLLLGVALRPAAGEFAVNGTGQLVAQGQLSKVLDTRLASVRQDANGPQIGISFRDWTGSDCRTFSSSDKAGLACHQGKAWVIGTLVSRPRENAGEAYRMAGSEMPDAVRRAVTENIDGAPFDADAEARARDNGWSGR
jgi:hypothetical protein